MIPGIYIDNTLQPTISQGGLVLSFPKMSEIRNIPVSKDFRLIQISKSIDQVVFNETNSLKLTKNLSELFDISKQYKYIINFATEEVLLDEAEINYFKNTLNGQILFLTNNVEYFGREDFLIYNGNNHGFGWLDDTTLTVNDKGESFMKYIELFKKNDLGTIKKKFMFLNNHYSDIRFDILKQIYKTDKQSHGNISFNQMDFSSGYPNELKFKEDLNLYNIPYPLHYDTYPGITHIGDMERSRNKILEINHIGTVNINYRLYFEIFFEIITETEHLFKMPGCYLSEKVYKPVKVATPFIYYGKPALKIYLEKLGMKFTSPIYFFGEGIDFMNHLDFLLNKDIEWHNEVSVNYIDEYLWNLNVYIKSQLEGNFNLLNMIYK
jgi:hypothetical protein